jgi:hypothetical protein
MNPYYRHKERLDAQFLWVMAFFFLGGTPIKIFLDDLWLVGWFGIFWIAVIVYAVRIHQLIRRYSDY